MQIKITKKTFVCLDMNRLGNRDSTWNLQSLHGLHIIDIENDVAEALIEKGADLNAKEGNGWSALMFASMGGATECVKMLIMAGADVNCKTNEGETPLQRAEQLQEAKLGDYKEIIEVLKGAGGE